jgi:serine O-acetyltransferase
MDSTKWQTNRMPGLVDEILETYARKKGISHIEGVTLPQRDVIFDVLDGLFRILFPGFIGKEHVRRANLRYYVGNTINVVYERLVEQLEKTYQYQCQMQSCHECDFPKMARETAEQLLDALPRVRELLKKDVQAAYEGDPAASSFDEIILSYPFINAITTHRIAHELYRREVPLIPRIMSERAHGMTGIDIHPGARIGEYFFIDHGTGVVIGETTEIGRNVKLYQGVTLGALSFPKDEHGNIIKGGKRHPTIEDNVTVYAGATILGGETVIGKGAVIGGNVWITESVPPGAKVTLTPEGQQRFTPPKKRSA